MPTDEQPRREARIRQRVPDEDQEMDLVFILWRDAHADRSGAWLDLDEIEDEPYIVYSAGFLLRGVKKGHVSIAQSLGAEYGVVDHVLHIPNEMVVSMGSVGLPKIKQGLAKQAKPRAKRDK